MKIVIIAVVFVVAMRSWYILLVILIVEYELIEETEADDNCKNSKANLDAVKLKTDLLCSYEKSVRPKVKNDEETKVLVRLLVKSFEFDVHSDSFKLNSWLTVAWYDDHLKWKKEDYGNIRRLPMPSDDIWVPDLAIYNRADQSGSPEIISSVTCQVYSHGQVIVVAPFSEKGVCVPKLRRYPFDEQVCKIRIGSWIYSGEDVNITLHSKSPVSLEDLSQNGEFDLINVKSYKNPGVYKCCPNNTYPSLNYIFTIKRYSSAVAATYVIPALIMVMLTLSSLWLNIEGLDRLCVCCSNVIIHFLYIQNVWWNLPSGGTETPLLIIYSRDSLLLSGVSLFLTVVLRTLNQTKQVSPIWMSSTVSMMINNPVGRVLFFFDANNKTVSTAKGDEDAERIIENVETTTNSNQDWVLFAKVIDKLVFVIFLIVYFCMFIGFLP